ncbi:vacuolar protein sorting-associated protein 4A-like [Diabrotica virgifera virgifera]|uniref:ATPase AAA-type core domain-containing protein n=1 Tax=Diabrotica virgifera virgifera TaxID=50390 RepID=A0ABM5KDA2_DIAVI|nr:vacuolar protein sorting-associated protein 4A-like [Diabrotica virgifera virgifera]
MLKLLFRLARKFNPTTIFVDKVDALVHQEASKRFKSELLTQIDGVQNCPSNVFVLDSPNSPWNLDPALLRRFEKRILVPPPDEASSQKLLKKYLSHNDVQTNELEELAKLTDNFPACDIKVIQ